MTASTSLTVQDPCALLDEIQRTLQAICEPYEVYELRCMKAKRILSGYYDNLDALAQDAYQSAVNGYKVNLTLNPVRPELLARANNRLRDYPEHATGDEDIRRRRWILLDCDPTRPSGISSTDDEHDAALERAFECHDRLIAMGIPANALIVADSGNGAHILMRVDLEDSAITSGGKAHHHGNLVDRVLKAVAWWFADDEVSVDTCVGNAGRLCKVYGTPARKGDPTSERSHRVAGMLDTPRDIVPVEFALLQMLASLCPTDLTAPTTMGASTFDVAEWIRQYLPDPPCKEGPWQGGRKFIFSQCWFNPDHDDKSAYIVQLPNGALAAGCHHDSCHWEWKELREKYEPEHSSNAGPVSASADASTLPPAPQKHYPNGRSLIEVPELGREMVPLPLRQWLEDIAATLCLPLECVACPAIVAVASVVGSTVAIRPDRYSDRYIVPNLWGALIARPGDMKSGAVDEALKPLKRLDTEARKRFDRENAENFTRVKRLEAEHHGLELAISEAARGQDCSHISKATSSCNPNQCMD